MTPDEKHAYARQFPVHVGVDTAKQFHVLVAQGPDGRRTKPFKVLVSRAGFEATDAHLRALFPEHTPRSDARVLRFRPRGGALEWSSAPLGDTRYGLGTLGSVLPDRA